jgi:hypothetical protein
MADERSKSEIAADVAKVATGIAAAITNSAPQTFPKPPEQQVVEKASDAYVEQRKEYDAQVKRK